MHKQELRLVGMSNKKRKISAMDDDSSSASTDEDDGPPIKRARKTLVQDISESPAESETKDAALSASTLVVEGLDVAADALAAVDVDVDIKCRGKVVTVFAKHLPHLDLVSTFVKNGGQGTLNIDFKADDLHAVLDALCEGKDFLFVYQWPASLRRIVKYLLVNHSKYADALKELKEACILRARTFSRTTPKAQPLSPSEKEEQMRLRRTDPGRAWSRESTFGPLLSFSHNCRQAREYGPVCLDLVERFGDLLCTNGAPVFETSDVRIFKVDQREFTYQVKRVVPVMDDAEVKRRAAVETRRQDEKLRRVDPVDLFFDELNSV
jgi:hypothetical protein